MTFGQRFIYVGVGGSGQTIGRELERMLRKQICGSNGNKARSQQMGSRVLSLTSYQVLSKRFISILRKLI